MDWLTSPLLREEIEGPGSSWKKLSPQYKWSLSQGIAFLMWQGQAIGAVHCDGRFWVKWRGKEHQGKAGSQAQGKRFMQRWLTARKHPQPVLKKDMPPSTLVPMEVFLRQCEDGLL